MIASPQRFSSEVAQFSAISRFRHPGFDQGSFAATALWTPDQVRGDDDIKHREKTSIANEVRRFSGLSR